MGAHSLVSIANKCSPNPAQISADANRAKHSLSKGMSPPWSISTVKGPWSQELRYARIVANPDRTPFCDNFRTASDPHGTSSRIGLRSRRRLMRWSAAWFLNRTRGIVVAAST